MAKKKKPFIPLSQMDRKAKILHFLKLFGICLAGVLGVFSGVALYVWATGGFNPPYEPLTTLAFSQSEYVIDGNKNIQVDELGNQVFENGNLVFVQQADENDEPVYEQIMLVPNEGCTELDAVIEISFSSNTDKPVIQLVEDDNTKVIENENEVRADGLHEKYSVKINSPIYIKPVTQVVTNEVLGEKEVNLGGWVMLTATQGQIQTSCWVYVDTPIEKLELTLDGWEDLVVSADEETEDLPCFNIDANQNLHVSTNYYPSTSVLLPKSNVPSSKSTTAFLDEKVIQYTVSDTDFVSIDQNGNITIKEKKYGEIFYIDAMIVSKYRDINSLPSYEDFEGDPSQSAAELLKKALNKLVVRGNRLYFKVKDVEVTGLTTYTGFTSKPYAVGEFATITFSNSIELSSVGKNNYFVDIKLSDESNASLKNQLYGNIKLAAIYEGEVATEEVDGVHSLEDIRINGRKAVLADNFIQIAYINNEWHYVVKQYASNNFYFVFYYEMDDEILHIEIPFTISKVPSEITTNVESIYLTYNEDVVFYYDLDEQVAYLSASGYTYTDMKFFVPADASQLVYTENPNIKLK